MTHVAKLCLVSFVCSVLLACILVLTIARLVEERSKETIRLTVSSEELLPTIRQLQGATGRVMNAYPLDGEEDEAKYWRVELAE